MTGGRVNPVSSWSESGPNALCSAFELVVLAWIATSRSPGSSGWRGSGTIMLDTLFTTSALVAAFPVGTDRHRRHQVAAGQVAPGRQVVAEGGGRGGEHHVVHRGPERPPDAQHGVEVHPGEAHRPPPGE